MHGYVHSNYAGITGSLINPSSPITSKLYLDINLAGMHLNLDNNYLFLSKRDYQFKNFLSNELPVHYDPIMDEDKKFYDRYDPRDHSDLKNGWTQIRIMGPSAMFATGTQAFGLSTSYRIMGSVNSLAYDLAKFSREGMDYYPQHMINYTNNTDARFASLALAEIAASYSRILYRYNRNYVSGGITIKGLASSGGVFGFYDHIDYVVPDFDDIILYNSNMKVGVSLPMDYDNNEFKNKELFLGKGIGFDIGFTYQQMFSGHTSRYYSRFSEIPFREYIYRIGVSLLDIGSVKFNVNPMWLEMVNASGTWVDAGIYEYDNLNEFFQTMDNSFSIPTNSSLIRYSDFTISLPTALSIQFDYSIDASFYVNSTWIQPLVMAENTVIRPAQISLTPRFEINRFGIAMPMVLYNYRYPRIGISGRFKNVIIGSDKLGGFFGMRDFTGMDFYVMVKLQFYRGANHNVGNSRCGNFEYRSPR